MSTKGFTGKRSEFEGFIRHVEDRRRAANCYSVEGFTSRTVKSRDLPNTRLVETRIRIIDNPLYTPWDVSHSPYARKRVRSDTSEPKKPQAPTQDELTAFLDTLPPTKEIWVIVRSRNDSEGRDYEFAFAQSLNDLPQALLHASGIRDTIEAEIALWRLEGRMLDANADGHLTTLRMWARELTGDDYQILHGDHNDQGAWQLTPPA